MRHGGKVAPGLAVLFSLLLGGGGQASAQEVAVVIERIARFWADEDAGSIAEQSAREGISINLDGRALGPLGGRQVTAVLRQLFQDHQTLRVRPMTPQMVGGEPPKAFGEITWQQQPRGTTIPEKTSVFVALVLQDGRWRISEIRVLRS